MCLNLMRGAAEPENFKVPGKAAAPDNDRL
jgi:hypothetical protein